MSIKNHASKAFRSYYTIGAIWISKNVYSIEPIKVKEHTKEQFVYRCKTDSEFSEKWGLKIEERELSLEERLSMVKQKNIQDIISDIPNAKKDEKNGQRYLDYCKIRCDIDNIPTKLITIKYNDETLEGYE